MLLDAFHNYFRASAIPDVPLYELCYLSAYEALPTAVEKDGEEFWKQYYLASYPALAWYTHLCLLSECESDPYSASTLVWYKGRLNNGREYMVLEYPEPIPYQELEEYEETPILAPYFSAVLRTTTTKPAACYALGPTPFEERTTLRLCRSAAHYNLGAGPEPTLQKFVTALETIEEMLPLGVTVRFPNHLDEEDRELMKAIEE